MKLRHANHTSQEIKIQLVSTHTEMHTKMLSEQTQTGFI